MLGQELAVMKTSTLDVGCALAKRSLASSTSTLAVLCVLALNKTFISSTDCQDATKHGRAALRPSARTNQQLGHSNRDAHLHARNEAASEIGNILRRLSTHSEYHADHHQFGPRDTAKHSRWPRALRMHSSVTPKILLRVFFIGAWAAGISIISEEVCAGMSRLGEYESSCAYNHQSRYTLLSLQYSVCLSVFPPTCVLHPRIVATPQEERSGAGLLMSQQVSRAAYRSI